MRREQAFVWFAHAGRRDRLRNPPLSQPLYTQPRRPAGLPAPSRPQDDRGLSAGHHLSPQYQSQRRSERRSDARALRERKGVSAITVALSPQQPHDAHNSNRSCDHKLIASTELPSPSEIATCVVWHSALGALSPQKKGEQPACESPCANISSTCLSSSGCTEDGTYPSAPWKTFTCPPKCRARASGSGDQARCGLKPDRVARPPPDFRSDAGMLFRSTGGGRSDSHGGL
jgi:hypothetical protein